MDNWPFGEIMCKLLPLSSAVSVFVSVLSMTMIAIDRYQALIKPLKRRMSHRVPRSLLIATIWITATLLAIPNAAFNTVVEYGMTNTILPSASSNAGSGDSGEPTTATTESSPLPDTIASYENELLIRCQVNFPKESEVVYSRLMTCISVTSQFFIPLLIVGFAYTMIGLKISKRTCIGETTVEQAQTHLNAKRKTIKMLIFVVVVFALCWLPFNLLYIFKDFYDISFSLWMHYATHWLAMTSICYNPFIYYWLNNGYRQGFRQILPCCCGAASSTATQTTDPEQNRTTQFQRSLSRSYSSGFPAAQFNSINHNNNNNLTATTTTSTTINGNAINNNNNNIVRHSPTEKESKLSQIKSNKSMPTMNNHNGSNGKSNDTHSNNNGNNTNNASTNGATSRHLQIIYISLKEKYGKDVDDEEYDDEEDEEEEEDSEEQEFGQQNQTYTKKQHPNFKRCTVKKVAGAKVSPESESKGEYFELLECIGEEKPEDGKDLGLTFLSG